MILIDSNRRATLEHESQRQKERNHYRASANRPVECSCCLAPHTCPTPSVAHSQLHFGSPQPSARPPQVAWKWPPENRCPPSAAAGWSPSEASNSLPRIRPSPRAQGSAATPGPPASVAALWGLPSACSPGSCLAPRACSNAAGAAAPGAVAPPLRQSAERSAVQRARDANAGPGSCGRAGPAGGRRHPTWKGVKGLPNGKEVGYYMNMLLNNLIRCLVVNSAPSANE